MPTKISPQLIKKLRDGESVIVPYLGKEYWVSQGLFQHALAQFEAGGEVFVLAPTWVNNALGPMEELYLHK